MRYTEKNVKGLMKEVARITGLPLSYIRHQGYGAGIYQLRKGVGSIQDGITSLGTSKEIYFELKAWLKGWEAGFGAARLRSLQTATEELQNKENQHEDTCPIIFHRGEEGVECSCVARRNR